MSAPRLRAQGTDPRIGDRVRPALPASVTVPGPRRFTRPRSTEVAVALEDVSVSGVAFRCPPLPVGVGAVVPMRVGPCALTVRIRWHRDLGDGNVRYGAEVVTATREFFDLVTAEQARAGRAVPGHVPER